MHSWYVDWWRRGALARSDNTTGRDVGTAPVRRSDRISVPHNKRLYTRGILTENWSSVLFPLGEEGVVS